MHIQLLCFTTSNAIKMKFKLACVFLLAAAAAIALATAVITEEEGSEAVSTACSYGDSALVTLLKVETSCLNRQLAVCESLLATATRNCQSCKCLYIRL